MGQNGSSPTEFSASSIEKQYVFEKESNDPRLGPIKIYKERKDNNQFAFCISKSSTDEDFQSLSRDIVQRSRLRNENLCRIIGYYHDDSQKLCGSVYRLYVYSEYFKNNLEKEILKKAKVQEYFTEPELWYLLDTVTSAYLYLEKNNIVHGDLSPQNIFIDPNGLIKLADNSLLSFYKNSYFKVLMDNGKRCLAPELLENLYRKDFGINYFSGQDVFLFGMTLLNAALLTDPYVCYENGAFNANYLNTLINSIQARYSPFFLQILVKMLNFNPNQRISWPELFDIFRNFKPNQPQPEIRRSSPIHAPPNPNQQTVQYRPVIPEQQTVYQQDPNLLRKEQEFQKVLPPNQIPPQQDPNLYNYVQGPQPQVINQSQAFYQQKIVKKPQSETPKRLIPQPPEQKSNIQVQNNQPVNPNPNQLTLQQIQIAQAAHILTQNPQIISQNQTNLPNIQPQAQYQQRNVAPNQRIIQGPPQNHNYSIPAPPQNKLNLVSPQNINQNSQFYNNFQQPIPQPQINIIQPNYNGYAFNNEQEVNLAPQMRYVENKTYIPQQFSPPKPQSNYYYAKNNIQQNFGENQNNLGQIDNQQNEKYTFNNSDLDRRIQEALKASEDTLKRNQEYLQRSSEK